MARIVAHLNQIAPDTFDGGELGPWRFHSLEEQPDGRLLLIYSNADGRNRRRRFRVPSQDFDQVVDLIIRWTIREDQDALGI